MYTLLDVEDPFFDSTPNSIHCIHLKMNRALVENVINLLIVFVLLDDESLSNTGQTQITQLTQQNLHGQRKGKAGQKWVLATSKTGSPLQTERSGVRGERHGNGDTMAFTFKFMYGRIEAAMMWRSEPMGPCDHLLNTSPFPPFEARSRRGPKTKG